MAAMLLSGLGMGVVFDGYRVVSNELKFPRWWLPVLDIVYWMAAALAVFRILYASNNGEVRAYVFIGLAVGVIVYYLLLSRIVIVIVKWLVGAVRALVNFTLKLLNFVIVKPIMLLYKLARVILGFGTALSIFLLKIVLQLVRPFWLLLVWMTRPAVRPLVRLLGPHIAKWRLREKMNAFGQYIAQLWSKWLRRPPHK